MFSTKLPTKLFNKYLYSQIQNAASYRRDINSHYSANLTISVEQPWRGGILYAAEILFAMRLGVQTISKY